MSFFVLFKYYFSTSSRKVVKHSTNQSIITQVIEVIVQCPSTSSSEVILSKNAENLIGKTNAVVNLKIVYNFDCNKN